MNKIDILKKNLKLILSEETSGKEKYVLLEEIKKAGIDEIRVEAVLENMFTHTDSGVYYPCLIPINDISGKGEHFIEVAVCRTGHLSRQILSSYPYNENRLPHIEVNDNTISKAYGYSENSKAFLLEAYYLKSIKTSNVENKDDYLDESDLRLRTDYKEFMNLYNEINEHMILDYIACALRNLLEA